MFLGYLAIDNRVHALNVSFCIVATMLIIYPSWFVYSKISIPLATLFSPLLLLLHSIHVQVDKTSR